MKKSWNRCVEFSQIAQAYLAGREGKGETKLTYAINRVMTRLAKQQNMVSDKLADIEIDHCVTESRNGEDVIVRDGQGGLQYTKEGIKKRNSAKTAYLSAEEFEVEPHFATKLPDDLSFMHIEAFAGFVIKDEDAARLLAELEAKVDSDDTSSDGEAKAASA